MILYGSVLSSIFLSTILSGVAGILEPSSAPSVASFSSPVAPAPTCIDDPTYRRNKIESKNCDWIGRVDSRRDKLCRKKFIRSKCRKTCSNCCANDLEYTITTDTGENYKCWWIGRKLSRQTKYCSTENNGFRVDIKCPKSCGLCGTETPSDVPSENPMSYPSASPTSNPPQTSVTSLPSSLSTQSPTTLKSDQPSQVSSIAPSVEVTNIHSSEPSNVISSAVPSTEPSYHPSSVPSLSPTLVHLPSKGPSFAPNVNLSPSSAPFAALSLSPSANPSHSPSAHPSPYASTVSTLATLHPSIMQSAVPSGYPSFSPTRRRTSYPSPKPTSKRSSLPSMNLSSSPSIRPSIHPSLSQSTIPTVDTPSSSVPKSDQLPEGPSFAPTQDSSQSPTKISSSPSLSLHPSMSPSKSRLVPTASTRTLMPSPVPSTMIPVAPSVSPSSIPPVTCSEDPNAKFFLRFKKRSPHNAIFQTCTWLKGRNTFLQSEHCKSTAAFGNTGPANTVCMQTCGVCS